MGLRVGVGVGVPFGGNDAARTAFARFTGLTSFASYGDGALVSDHAGIGVEMSDGSTVTALAWGVSEADATGGTPSLGANAAPADFAAADTGDPAAPARLWAEVTAGGETYVISTPIRAALATYDAQPAFDATDFAVGAEVVITKGTTSHANASVEVVEFALDGVDRSGDLVDEGTTFTWDSTGEDIYGADGAIGYRERLVTSGGYTLSDNRIAATLTDVPQAPTLNSVTNQGDGSVELIWTENDNGNLASIDTQYRINGSDPLAVPDVPPQVVSGGGDGVDKDFQIRVQNGVGWSAWSNVVQETVTGSPPTDTTPPDWTEDSFDDATRTLAGTLTEASGAATLVWATADPAEDPTFTIGGGWSGTNYETGSVVLSAGANSQTIPITDTTPDGSRELTAYFHDAANNIDGPYRYAVTVDNTPPTVALRTPLDNATDVAVNSAFVIEFDESMARTGIYALRLVGGAVVETFDLATGAGDNGGTAAWSTNSVTDDRLTLTLGANLAVATAHAWRRTGLEDVRGNALPDVTDDTTYNFTTAAAASPSPPVVASVGTRGTSADNTTLVVPYPAGIQAGDRLLFIAHAGQLGADGSGNVIASLHAGFTRVEQSGDNIDPCAAAIRIADGTETGNATFVMHDDNCVGRIIRITGAGAVDDAAAAEETVITTTMTSPGVTTTVDDCLVVRVLTTTDAARTITLPAGETELFNDDYSNGGALKSLSCAATYFVQSSAGATGTAVFTDGGAGQRGGLVTIAIRPA